MVLSPFQKGDEDAPLGTNLATIRERAVVVEHKQHLRPRSTNNFHHYLRIKVVLKF